MSIKSLNAETVKLIKSSQVVSNVWSVVKELVENALDANATNVEVYLVENGLSVIKVSDNGLGISKEDAAYMGLPSYTSKLANFKDLDSLTSYGFRGVALNSICALGEVTVTTKTNSDQVATIYTLNHNGEITKTAESHGNRGTTIQVKDLCKGLPVRRKILSESKAIKKDVKNVETLIKDFCICNPGVRFVLQINGKMTFTKPIVKDLKEALIQVVGRANAMKLHGFNHSIGGIEVELLVPKKDSTNLSEIFKSGQSYIFVNKRPVKHKAIEQIILTKITEHFSSDHPNVKKSLFVVNISVNPADVDVNLEPNKDRVLLHNQEKVEIVLDEILSDYYGLQAIERSNSDKENNAETPNHSLNPFDETSYNPDSSRDSSFINNVNDPAEKEKEKRKSHDNEPVKIKRVVKTPVLSDPESDEDVGKTRKKSPSPFNTMSENSRLDNEKDRQTAEETLSQLPVVNLGDDFDLSDLHKHRISNSSSVDKRDQNTSEISKDVTVEIGSDAWSRGRIAGGGGVDVLPVNYVDLDCKNGSIVTKRSPKSAFGIFFNDERSQIMRENPDAKETEVAKQITQKWNDLSSEERGYYRDQAMKQQEALTPRSQKRSLQDDDQENNRRKILKYLTIEKHENTEKHTLLTKRTILPWNVTLQDVKNSFKKALSPKRKPDSEFTVAVIGRAPDNDNFWFVNYDKSNWIINIPALLKESKQENILLCQVTSTLLKQLLNEKLSKSVEIDPTVMHHIHDHDK